MGNSIENNINNLFRALAPDLIQALSHILNQDNLKEKKKDLDNIFNIFYNEISYNEISNMENKIILLYYNEKFKLIIKKSITNFIFEEYYNNNDENKIKILFNYLKFFINNIPFCSNDLKNFFQFISSKINQNGFNKILNFLELVYTKEQLINNYLFSFMQIETDINFGINLETNLNYLITFKININNNINKFEFFKLTFSDKNEYKFEIDKQILILPNQIESKNIYMTNISNITIIVKDKKVNIKLNNKKEIIINDEELTKFEISKNNFFDIKYFFAIEMIYKKEIFDNDFSEMNFNKNYLKKIVSPYIIDNKTYFDKNYFIQMMNESTFPYCYDIKNLINLNGTYNILLPFFEIFCKNIIEKNIENMDIEIFKRLINLIINFKPEKSKNYNKFFNNLCFIFENYSNILFKNKEIKSIIMNFIDNDLNKNFYNNFKYFNLIYLFNKSFEFKILEFQYIFFHKIINEFIPKKEYKSILLILSSLYNDKINYNENINISEETILNNLLENYENKNFLIKICYINCIFLIIYNNKMILYKTKNILLSKKTIEIFDLFKIIISKDDKKIFEQKIDYKLIFFLYLNYIYTNDDKDIYKFLLIQSIDKFLLENKNIDINNNNNNNSCEMIGILFFNIFIDNNKILYSIYLDEIYNELKNESNKEEISLKLYYLFNFIHINIKSLISKNNEHNNFLINLLALGYYNNYSVVTDFQKFLNNTEIYNKISEDIITIFQNLKLVLKDINIFLHLSKLYYEISNDKQNNKRNYKKINQSLYLFGGFWKNKISISKLKYKRYNFLTNDFKKPILYPIIDINYYLPKFKEKVKKDLIFLENDSNENILYPLYNNKNINFLENLLNLSNDNIINYITLIYDKPIIYKCCLIKISHHIKGYFIFYLNDCYFYSLNDQNKKEDICIKYNNKEPFDNIEKCFGSNFICPEKDKLKVLNLKTKDIKFILKRIYFLKKTALEIITFSGKDYYFNFHNEKDYKEVLNKIIKINQNNFLKIIIKEKNNSDNEHHFHIRNTLGYINKNYLNNHIYQIKNFKRIIEENIDLKKYNNIIEIQTILNLWNLGLFSNYEILSLINILSNRSYNDLYQYPVFPWLLFNNEKRDLKLPIGQIIKGNGVRKKLFEDTYNLMIEELKTNKEKELIDKSNISKAYYYNTNYSNPFYVCYFLIRLIPFCFSSIYLQGDFFDVYARLFNDLENSLENNLIQKSDIKESIPEFYFLPELYLNLNKLNLKKLNQKLNKNIEKTENFDVKLNDTYIDYTIKLKNLLEEKKYKIKDWMLLIFGKDQKKETNLFRPASYLDNPENYNFKNIKEQKFRLTENEFGMIPLCVIPEEIKCKHREKKILNIFDSKINYIIKKYEQPIELNKIYQFYYNENNKSTFILFDENNLYILNIEMKKITSKQGYFNNIPIIYYILDDNYLKENIYLNLEINNRAIFLIKAPYEKFINSEIKKKTSKYISAFEIIKYNENFYYLLGYTSGLISLYEDNNSNSFLELKKDIYKHTNKIISIKYNYNLNLWLSISEDNIINVYTFKKCKIIKHFILNEKINFAFLCSSPIPSIIMYINNAILKTIELNNLNELISLNNNDKNTQRQMEIKNIIKPKIIKGYDFNDHLLCSNIYLDKIDKKMKTNIVYIDISDYTKKTENVKINEELDEYFIINNLNEIIAFKYEQKELKIIYIKN